MKHTLLLLSFLLAGIAAPGQTEKIPLWPGLAPGTEGRKNTETVDAGGSISQIYQPELTYFPAPDQAAPAPAILVCPGGGYRSIVIEKEGVRIARWFQKRGFAAFVLKYRLAPPEALQDARRAMRVIRSNAAQYRIDPAKISVVGFSAGGNLCARLAVTYTVTDAADETDKISARPNFCAPIYGVFEPPRPANLPAGQPSDERNPRTGVKDLLTRETPPMFLAHAVDDNKVPVEQSLDLFVALRAKGIPAELHLYEKSSHGFALDPDRGHATSWGEAFLLWLKAHGVEGKPAQKS